MRIPYEEAHSYAETRAKDFGVDPKVATAILYSENVGKSGQLPEYLDTATTSGKEAIGPMQVRKSTHASLVRMKYLPPDSQLEGDNWQAQIDAGLAALSEMQQSGKTTDPIQLAAYYNGGTNGLRLAREGKYDALHPETRGYLQKFKAGFGEQLGSSQRDVRMVDNAIQDQAAVTPGAASTSSGTVQEKKSSDAITSMLENYKTMFGTLTGQLTSSREEQLAATEKEKAAVVAEGAAKADVEMAKGEIATATTRLHERILSILNLNTNAADNLIATSMANQRDLQARREPLAAEIDKRMSVGFFDNPIEWLINQTILPGQVSAHNALVRQENDITKRVNEVQAIGKVQESIDVAADADTLAKSAAAMAKADIATAAAKSAHLDTAASGLKSQTALQLAHLIGTQASIEGTSIQRALVLQQKDEQATIKQGEREELARKNIRLQQIGDMIGAPNVNMGTLKGRGAKVLDDWGKAADSGTVGDSLGEALTFIGKYGNVNNIKNQLGRTEQGVMLQDLQTKVYNDSRLIIGGWSQSPAGQGGAKAPTQEQAFQMAAQNLEQTWRRVSATDMGLAEKDNPYRIDHTLMAKNWKGDPQNPIYLMVKQSLAQGLNLTDKQVMLSVEKAVEAKQIDLRTAAAALADYYSYGIARNNTARNFKILGMDEQKDYVLQPHKSFQAIDMTNATRVENYLTGKVTKSMALGIPGFEFMDMVPTK